MQISNLLEKEYDAMKECMAIEMKHAVESGKIGISVDLWSDKFRNISYLGMVAHYILWNEETKTANLSSCVLKLQEMDAHTPKTANVVHEQVISVLNEFDLQDNTDRIVFITDRGKNIMNACDGYARQSCFDHFINNVVGEMVKEIEAMRVNIAKV